MRAARARADGGALARLARSANVAGQSPAFLALLGTALPESANAERVALLRRAQRRHPGDFWINHDLAASLYAAANPVSYRPPTAAQRALLHESVRYHSAALALRPDSPGAHLNLGNALYALGDLDGAESAYRRAAELGGRYASAEHNLGMVLSGRGDRGGAVAALKRAIALEPGNAGHHIRLGAILFRKGDRPAAEAAMRRAVEVGPQDAAAWVGLGVVLRARGDLPAARAALERAVRLRPGEANAHCQLGVIHGQLGDRAASIASYRAAVRADPWLLDAHYNLGNALQSEGDREGAARAYRRLLELSPRDPAGLTNYAGLLIRKGDAAGAEPLLRRALEVEPKLAEAHGALGNALLVLGRYDEAAAEARASLALLPAGHPVRPTVCRLLNDCERLHARDARLTAFLTGAARPTNALERLQLADQCRHPARKLFAASARLFAEALPDRPPFVDDPRTRVRYAAACSAALATSGAGKDAAGLTTADRARLRGQALEWLRADLEAWARLVEAGQPGARAEARRTLEDWHTNPDLAVGREGAEGLPADERDGWRRLWCEVGRLLARCEAAGP